MSICWLPKHKILRILFRCSICNFKQFSIVPRRSIDKPFYRLLQLYLTLHFPADVSSSGTQNRLSRQSGSRIEWWIALVCFTRSRSVRTHMYINIYRYIQTTSMKSRRRGGNGYRTSARAEMERRKGGRRRRRRHRWRSRNRGERNWTIMMRFIEPIVPGIQVHRHNRHVSTPDTVERRYSIDFQFLDGVTFVCASPGYDCWKGPVSICAFPPPLFPGIH